MEVLIIDFSKDCEKILEGMTHKGCKAIESSIKDQPLNQRVMHKKRSMVGVCTKRRTITQSFVKWNDETESWVNDDELYELKERHVDKNDR